MLPKSNVEPTGLLQQPPGLSDVPCGTNIVAPELVPSMLIRSEEPKPISGALPVVLDIAVVVLCCFGIE
ncbi:hypothetical protein V6N13_128144 [Hibiscus sabdariffa]